MTDISKTNMLNRWENMCKVDLGYEVNPIATAMRNVVSDYINSNIKGHGAAQNIPNCLSRIMRGFQFNHHTEGRNDRYFIYVNCLDLNYMEASDEGITDFEYYMMVELGWMDKYHYALDELGINWR